MSPPSRADAGHEFTTFVEVNVWVFDLDNTLYPRDLKIFEQIDRRIKEFVGRRLALDHAEVHRVQKDYRQRYGTTLRGLMQEHRVHPDDFLEYVHDIDHRGIEANPRLSDAIARLPGRKFIMTNGSRRHAEKIVERLGFSHHFEDIFDIVRAELLPKPDRRPYERFVAAAGVTPKKAAMFEDLPANLLVPKALGMQTILVLPGKQTVLQEDWELEGQDGAHIDYRTDDLVRFLEKLPAAMVPKTPSRA